MLQVRSAGVGRQTAHPQITAAGAPAAAAGQATHVLLSVYYVKRRE